jgi:hypothetical protein
MSQTPGEKNVCPICLDETYACEVLWQCCNQKTCARCLLSILPKICPFCREKNPSIWHPMTVDSKKNHPAFVSVTWTNYYTFSNKEPKFGFQCCHISQSASIKELRQMMTRQMAGFEIGFVFAGTSYSDNCDRNDFKTVGEVLVPGPKAWWQTNVHVYIP